MEWYNYLCHHCCLFHFPHICDTEWCQCVTTRLIDFRPEARLSLTYAPIFRLSSFLVVLFSVFCDELSGPPELSGPTRQKAEIE